MPEIKLEPAKVPDSLRPLYEDGSLTSVWKSASGLTLIGSLGAVEYGNWGDWGSDFWNARQDIKAYKLTEWSMDTCGFSVFAFAAAKHELAMLDRAVEEAKDRKRGEGARYLEAREADEKKRSAPFVPPVQKPGVALRDYQVRAIGQLTELFKQGKRRILLVGPTGMGKMVLAAYLMEQCSRKGNPSLFLADFRELIGQCRGKLTHYGVPAGVIMSNSSDEANNALAQVASKDTLWARAFRTERISLPPAKVLIADEAHKSRSETWMKILDAYSGSAILGMTATPCRQDGKGLGAFYDAMVIVATYKELREAGWIVPSKVFAPSVPNLKGVHYQGGDYVKKELAAAMDKVTLVGDIVKDWRARADGRVTVVFASGVQHSIHIRNQFQRYGVSAEHVDSKNTSWTEREDILGRMKDGKLTVICNYGVLTTGWDEPSVSCMVCARPTRSLGLWRQMSGRILRSHPGKSDAIILDHSGAVFRHGYPDEDIEWELGEDKNIHEKIKDKIAKEATEERQPYACPKCTEVYRGPECPGCGYKPSVTEKAVKMKAGELKEVTRDKLRRDHSIAEKQKTWNQCLGRVVGTNGNLKSALAQYKQIYGVMPDSSIKRVPRGNRQWNMDAKEYWQAVMDYEKLGIGSLDNE
jgi:superfamily II DNA or RNA helicase